LTASSRLRYPPPTGASRGKRGELSERRADTVRDYMVSKGISASRITTRGFGEARPVASNQTADGRAENRRVEIIAE